MNYLSDKASKDKMKKRYRIFLDEIKEIETNFNLNQILMKKINFLTMIIALMVMGMGFGTSASNQQYGPNLVVNGDFSDNSAGTFTTEYLFVDPVPAVPNSLVPEGVYTIGANANSYHNNFVGTAFSAPYFLIVNGHTQQTMDQQGIEGTRAIVWQQTVDIEDGVDYEFSFRLSSLVPASPAELRIVIDINGEEMVEVVAPGTTNNWVKHVWSGMDKSKTATITIYDDNIVKSGNDFGIDDIVFRSLCPEFDEVVTEVNVTDVTCNGKEDGIIELILEGAKPFNACISAGCNTQYNEENLTPLKSSTYTYDGLMPGNYTITVVDANGCVYTECVNVGEPEVLDADVVITPILCADDLGEVTLTVTGGTPPYYFVLDGNEPKPFNGNTFTLSDVPGNTDFTWSIIDANGCELPDAILNIYAPDALEIVEISETPASCFGANDGSVEITVTGGTPPYSADMGTFTGDMLAIGNLEANNYDVKIYDANQCMIPASFTIDQPDPLILNVDVPLCYEEPSNAPGCDFPYIKKVIEYEVGFAQYGGGIVAANRTDTAKVAGVPDDSNNGNNGITFTTLGFGGHMIVELGCEVANGQGDDLWIVETSYGISDCSKYPEKSQIAVSQFPDGPWSILDTICLSGYVDLANGKDESLAPFVLESAKYVRITDLSDENDFRNGDGFDLNGIKILNPAQATPPPAVTFTFEGVEEGDNPIVTVMKGSEEITDLFNLEPGATYSAVLSVGGCESEPVTFTMPTPIEATAVVTNPTCNGGNDGSALITITGGSGDYKIEENNVLLPDQKDQQFQSSPILIEGLSAGTHTYTIFDDNGCMGEVTFTIIDPVKLEATAMPGKILCEGGTTTVELTVSGGNAPYVLSDDNSDFEQAITEAGTILVNLDAPAGTYNWTVTDANGEGCAVPVEEFVIEDADPIVVSAEDVTIECFGGTKEVTVTATSGNEDATFEYSLIKDEALAYGPQDNGVFSVTAGTYTVLVLEYFDGEPVCSNMEASFTATQPDAPLAANLVSKTDATCFGAKDGEAVINVTGGTPDYTFSMGDWINGQLVIKGLAAGTYDIEISDQCDVETVTVTIGQPDQLIITDVVVPTCTEDLANYPACEPYAVSIIDHNFGSATYGDGEVSDDRRILENVLGMPDTSNTGDEGITFVSLGNGGHIILELGCDVTNGEGNDLQIVEDSWGYNTCGTYKERAEIAVSQYEDGPWSYLGKICLSGSVDLENGKDEFGNDFVLDYASYVKVTDVTLTTDNNNGDGYDLNGIINLNPAPVPPTYPNLLVDISYEGVGNMYPEFLVEGEEGFSEIFPSSFIYGLVPGNYTVTLLAGDCASDPFAFFIPEPLQIIITSVTPASSEGMLDGEISGMITGGVGNYSVCYSVGCDIDPTKSGETLDKSMGLMYWGLQAGFHKIRVVDENGCMVEVCVEVPVATEEVVVNPDKNDTPLSDNLMGLEDSMVKVYPNPFQTQATFEFNLTQNVDVTLEVYNLIGERVAVVFQGTVNAFENHKAVFNAESLPDGIYIYKLTAGDYIFNDRVVLTR